MYRPESCVLFSTADWNAPYWTNKQHMALLFSRLGTKVLYVESIGLRKISGSSRKDWSRLFKRLQRGLVSMLFGPRQVQFNIWILSPLIVPFRHDSYIIKLINQNILKLQIMLFIRRQKLNTPLIWTYHPFMLKILENSVLGRLVYHCVDDLSAVPGIDASAFKVEELKLIKKADLIFTTANSLTINCKKYNKNTYFMANVVDPNHFRRYINDEQIPEDLACIPEPRLVFHGVLSDYKIDFRLLLEVVRMRPNWSFVFIGEEREGQKNQLVEELHKQSNVNFLGYRSYEILPNYLKGMQVGLLPNLINEYTTGMFPMKFYEYVASGLPVVSTQLSFSEAVNYGLKIGNTPSEFVEKIQEQLDHGKFTENQINEIIGDNTWDARMFKMLEILKSLEGAKKL